MGLKPRPTAGYSKTPLSKKLGIRDGFVVGVIGGPTNFSSLLAPLPEGATVRRRFAPTDDLRVLFATERSRLERSLRAAAMDVGRGGLWIAWPKRASGVPTDITEDVLRQVALPMGLVNVKVCAIDETWSGLRLYWRKR